MFDVIVCSTNVYLSTGFNWYGQFVSY